MNRIIAIIAAALFIAPAGAWNSHGHAVITYLALESARSDLPAWLQDEEMWRRAAYQASEADRWRGTRLSYLAHENAPDHYIDLEYLDQFGLTAQTIPPLRRDYLRAMAIAKVMHPERVDPYDAASDPNGTREWPGFLPHSIMEHYSKLRSSFHTVRVLEALNDPAREAHLEQARANAIYHMGMLSHFIGDGAQPLHTTKHFNGWAGDNPEGYTTDRGIHAYIDGGVLKTHDIGFPRLRHRVGRAVDVNADDPWNDAMAHIRRAFAEVEPLYRLHRDGDLDRAIGKRFIEERLLDAGRTLGGFYLAAWRHAAPTEEDLRTFLRYTGPLAPETTARQVDAAE